MPCKERIETNAGAYRKCGDIDSTSAVLTATSERPFYQKSFKASILLSAYRDFESRVDPIDEKLPSLEPVRKTVGDKIGKFTKSEIMEMAPSIGKTAVENALKS